MTVADPPARQLKRYLQAIAGGRRGDELLEIRYATGDGGMRRRFISIRRLDEAARAIRSLSPRSDVYCGVLLRSHRAGGRDAITRSHLAFVDIDAVDALDRLQRFARTPTMIVSSGTAGHAHAYWRLRTRVGAVELEQANRTLASHLGGDLASVDAARILRPAGSLSHKHRPPAPVELLHLDPAARFELAELLDGLPPAPRQPASATAGRGRIARTELDELLLAIPAATYVRELTGLELRHNGKVNCPFHADDTPSLQLYEDGTFYCYGCGAGGSLYDFAGKLWTLDTKGHGFLELRARLADTFGVRTSAGS
jgi:CHC2 zinc finger/RepB DNA-primase from phage plasmid